MDIIEMTSQEKYDELVPILIRAKYSITDEIKIVREYMIDMTDEDKKASFTEYYNFVEEMKKKAKSELQIEE